MGGGGRAGTVYAAYRLHSGEALETVLASAPSLSEGQAAFLRAVSDALAQRSR